MAHGVVRLLDEIKPNEKPAPINDHWNECEEVEPFLLFYWNDPTPSRFDRIRDEILMDDRQYDALLRIDDTESASLEVRERNMIGRIRDKRLVTFMVFEWLVNHGYHGRDAKARTRLLPEKKIRSWSRDLGRNNGRAMPLPAGCSGSREPGAA